MKPHVDMQFEQRFRRNMRFSRCKRTGEISMNNTLCMISRFLGTEPVKKAAFTALCSGILSAVVVQSGTSYTPPVDVFVYCSVYCAWVTMCLPWLVQNMNGKVLAMILGVVFRLFAVDAGVLAWSAFRGHRNILQRGLRMRPLFEPSMSWLAEAGYNLRYGVIISAIVASLVALLIDAYERVVEHNRVQRNSFCQDYRREAKCWSSRINKIQEAQRNSLNQYRDPDWEKPCRRELKIPRYGGSVRFNFEDNPSEQARDPDIRSSGKRGREESKQGRPFRARSSDTDTDDAVGEGEAQSMDRENAASLNDVRNSKYTRPGRDSSSAPGPEPPLPPHSVTGSRIFGVESVNEASADGVDDRESISSGLSKAKSSIRSSAGPSDSERGKTAGTAHSRWGTSSGFCNVVDEEENDELKDGRRCKISAAMEKALLESKSNIRNLRGKI